MWVRLEDRVKVSYVPSPNHGRRPTGTVIDTVVLHADAADDAQASVSWIKSPKSKVSYHALIDRSGEVFHFVDSEKRAWHAGVSSFQGRQNVNDFSIGLSFANKNDGKEPYTDAQYEAGAILVGAWMRLYPAISIQRITTHALIAPGRKTDPMGFDMPRFLDLVRADTGAE